MRRARSPRSSAQDGCWPSPSAAPSTPRSWLRPGTACARRSPTHLPRRPTPSSSPTSTPDPTTDPEEWPGLLSAQLCSPVRWRQTLDTLLGDGMQTFVELGPGGVLTGLARRMLPTAETIAPSRSPPPTSSTARRAPRRPGWPSGAAAGRRALPHDRATRRLAGSRALRTCPWTGRRICPGADRGDSAEPVQVAVGELIGLVGETEIRSAFAGTLEGIIVLAGERVAAASRSRGCGLRPMTKGRA